MFRLASFSDITPRVCRTTKERVGLIPVIPLLLPRLRKRLRGRGPWRLRWRRSRGPRRTPKGQGCGQDTGPREAETPAKGVLAPRVIDFRVPEQALFLFSYFYLFSITVANSLCCIPPLPRTLYSHACSVIFQPAVMAFLELAVIA